MSQLTTYNQYKPSGLDYLGEIPEHWEVKKLKYISENHDGKRVPLNGEERTGKEGSFPYFGANGIVDYIDEFIFDGTYVLVGEDGAPFFIPGRDVAWVATGKFWVNNHAHILKANEDIVLPKIFSHLLNIVDYKHYISGSTRDKLTQKDLSSIALTIPPLPEQHAIAAYLDAKTAQIDTLIQKKEELLQLLAKRRQAVISQAVTQGLNPLAPRRASGIEWLREIPAHWEVKKLKFIGEIRYGLGQPPEQQDDGLAMIRATNVERGKIVEKDLMHIDPSAVPYDRDPILKENDIIIVRSGAYTADSAIVPKKYAGSVAGYDMVLRVKEAFPKFIAYGILSDYILFNQLYLLRMRAAQPHLNKEELGETLVFLPPISEQQNITAFLEEKNAQLDQVVALTREQITSLRAYRQAVISDVVTGKVRVPDLQTA